MIKIQFDRENLLVKLKLIASILPKKPVLGAHEQFLFNVKGGVAAITSTDGQKQITVSCDTAKCDGDIMFTIPGRLLVNTLANLIDSDVKLSVKEGQVTLKCGSSTYKMGSEDGKSYPIIPEIKSDFEASFGGAIFNEALETAKRFTDAESSVVAYQGVNLHFGNGKMGIYGIQGGHAMCKIIVHPRSVNKWEDILIPASAVKAIVNCVSDSDIVDVFHDKQRLEVRTSSVSVVALALDIKYPDVERLYLDQGRLHTVKYNTVQFLSALNRLKPFAREEVPGIAINITSSLTTLTVDNIEYSRDGLEEINAISQRDCRMGMIIDYMINALESFTNDEFNIIFDTPEKPILIEPIGVAKENDKFILLAPLMLHN